MPHYTFRLEGGQAAAEPLAMDLPDLRAAKKEALRIASEIVANPDDSFWNNGAVVIDVSNGSQESLLRVELAATEANVSGADEWERRGNSSRSAD
jgi:hypothetical protein